MICCRTGFLPVLVATLLLVACETSRPPFRIDTERYAGLLDRRADSPGTLIAKRAADVYELEYFRATDHKAIAQSSNGAWAWTQRQQSPEAAMNDALAKCRELNGDREGDAPCRVVNVNGYWMADFSSQR